MIFSEKSEYGKIFEYTVSEHLLNFIHKTNLGITDYNLEELGKVYQDIIVTLVHKYQLFHSDTTDALHVLIEEFREKVGEDITKHPSKVIENARVTNLPKIPKTIKIKRPANLV